MVVDYVRANELLERAVEHARRAGDWGCVARARSFLAVYYLFGPTPAEDVITNLDKLVEQSGTSPRVRAEAEQVTCVMHAMCGRFAEARAVAAAAKADLAAVGQRIWLANIAQSTGYLEELAGDLDAAELEYERSTEALRSLGERAFLSTVAGLHARLLARRRRFAAAAEALALARESGSPDDLTTQSLIVQAELLLAAGQGDVDRARTLLAVPDPQDVAQVPDDAARVHETAALACRWLGDHEAERQHLQETRRLALVKGNVVRAAAALTRLSELPVGGGSCEESRAAIEK
jgi:hypothetical protein